MSMRRKQFKYSNILKLTTFINRIIKLDKSIFLPKETLKFYGMDRREKQIVFLNSSLGQYCGQSLNLQQLSQIRGEIFPVLHCCDNFQNKHTVLSRETTEQTSIQKFTTTLTPQKDSKEVGATIPIHKLTSRHIRLAHQSYEIHTVISVGNCEDRVWLCCTDQPHSATPVILPPTESPGLAQTTSCRSLMGTLSAIFYNMNDFMKQNTQYNFKKCYIDAVA